MKRAIAYKTIIYEPGDKVVADVDINNRDLVVIIPKGTVVTVAARNIVTDDLTTLSLLGFASEFDEDFFSLHPSVVVRDLTDLHIAKFERLPEDSEC